MKVVERVRQYAAQHRLWSAESRVVAAVSGGSDSVAMLFTLRELAQRGELRLAGLAHLNHHIRGADADADAAFCGALAERLGIPAFIGDADVPALAARESVSLEVAGRDARQRFYADVLSSAKAQRLALAHTQDDQAETVLLRLTRGAGTVGLAGIAPRRGQLVRPVLDQTRTDLQAYLRELGESWREDATNFDRTIPRNLIRHEVLPILRTMNAQADAALARAADALRVDAELLETLANAAYVRVVKSAPARELSGERRQDAEGDPGNDDNTVRVSAVELTKLPAALATRVARYALDTANPGGSYGLEEARALCAFAAGGTAIELSGLRMERFGANAVLLSKGSPQPAVEDFQLRLPVPGKVEAPHGAWAVIAEGPQQAQKAQIEAPHAVATESGGLRVVVDARELGDHLIVRPRRPGDRLQPLGAPGRRKVQDVLVDRKVPKDDRDRVPIVTTQTGDIVWVAGQVLADPFRVTSLTSSVVILTLRRV